MFVERSKGNLGDEKSSNFIERERFVENPHSR
jgi:hypothetical protein